LTGNITYNVISGTDSAVNTATFPASYKYADNSDATGVSVAIAVGTAWTNISSETGEFVRQGFSGARSGLGVFATPASPNNTNLFSDFTSAANSNSSTDYIGVRIGGLAAGTYTVYALSNNTYLNVAGANTRQIRAGTGAAGLTDYSGFAAATTLSYDYTNIAADTATWAAAEGKYWTSFTVNVTATNNTIYLGGFKSGDQQGGTFNSIMIIPEPGSLALVGIALGSLLLFRRRK
jgi:hypothetical protein